MSFENSDKYPIGDISVWRSGGTPLKAQKDNWDGDISWISAKTLKTGKIRDSETKITQKGLEIGSKLASVDNILLLVRGSGLFKDISIGIVEKPVAFNQDVKAIEVNFQIVTPSFFYYWLLANKPMLSNMLEHTGIGAGKLDIDVMKKLEIEIPSIQEQKSVTQTLSSIDDKIELNNRINKTLEEMAQTILKSWFVDFEPFQEGEFEDSEFGRIPKGWRVGTLGDIAYITMGQSPSGSSYNGNNDGIVFYQGRTDFGKRYPTIRLYTTEPKRMAAKGDILLCVRAPVGDINVASENCCIGRGLATLKSNNNCNSFLLYQLLNLKDSFNIYNGEGTVFGSINKDTLKNMRVLIPTDKNIQGFQDTVGKLDEIFENNSIQIKILTTIRDSLLPKLMSGEIRVPIEEVQ